MHAQFAAVSRPKAIGVTDCNQKTKKIQLVAAACNKSNCYCLELLIILKIIINVTVTALCTNCCYTCESSSIFFLTVLWFVWVLSLERPPQLP